MRAAALYTVAFDSQRSQEAQLRDTVAAAAAATRRDRLQLNFASIRAPIDGVAGLKLTDVGNLTGSSDPKGVEGFSASSALSARWADDAAAESGAASLS